ncbi:hypothetical protein BCR37DRAFT_385988 [Protomyces lactucae-debilis]|uniref:DUF726-domain-containing protein n=1 Tax=Protomyces lactucae-debilis TaxID=2754530 RepID=A0A1Y2FPP4_PROLT|nr:uncharacterized protein BCR37DRAFT_385988 [Protomyces lactucae-debilis]ORY85577.1 hypothetical protein BCR37DRAFT_385988 [Protomyces lactucae-debilis]
MAHSMKIEKDKDLNDILSPAQRADLTVLIGDALERMRQQLAATFTHEPASKDESALIQEAEKLSLAKNDIEDGEQTSTAASEAIKEGDVAAAQVPTINVDSKASPEWARDLQEPALAFFDEWRGQVLQRIGQAINTQHAGEQQRSFEAEEATSPSSFPFTETDKKVRLPDAIDTDLADISLEYKTLLLNALLLLLLSLETYSAYSRVLLKTIAASLKLPASLFLEVETQVSSQLQKAALMQHQQSEEEKRAKQASSRWKVGLASVAGAAIVGITGGLAAPLVAAGLGTVLGGIGLGSTVAAGYLGAMAGSSILVGALFGGYGAKMAGQSMERYAAEVSDFAFLPLKDQAEAEKPGSSRLSVTLGVAGWLATPEDITLPFDVLDDVTDAYALRYETKALLALGTALTDLMLSTAFSYAKKEIIRRTVFASLMVALWPLGLLKVGKLLDNPWRIAFTRSQKAGIVLADALCERVQGNRPISLVGYSLGSRVLYDCLKELARRKQFGLVENVVFMGAACPADSADWGMIRSVVAGRCINVYSSKDYILGFLYRTASIQLGVAGLQAVDAAGVDNIDVSADVEGHLRYKYLVGRVLRDECGWEGINEEATKKQEQHLQVLVKKEQAADETASQVDSNPDAPSLDLLFDANDESGRQANKNA